VQAPLLLALTAGMLGAVNPCGFALLPAYLSVLVAGDRGRPDSPRATVAALGRALRCTAALTTGYVAVFGAFGLLLAPVAGWLQPRLPWLTVVLGVALAVLGGWLLAGRRLPSPGSGMRAPRLTGSASSMVLFGMAYAVASLGCASGPFLAIVVAGTQASTPARGIALFVLYAAGMGLVIGVTAVAVALVRVSVVTRLRRAAAFVPRAGGAVLVLAGAYLTYYGWYEVRLSRDARSAVRDPLIRAASDLQHRVSGLVSELGAGWLVAVLAVLLLAGLVAGRRRRSAPSAVPSAEPSVEPSAAPVVVPVGSATGGAP
jgi:cytochrome c-type biogenesis protein